MARLVLSFLLVCALAATTAAAQAKTNFAGTWSPVEGVNPPVDLIVTQTATALSAGSDGAAGHALTVKLDGTETLQSEGNVRSTAQWDGARLIITHTMANTASVQKQVWSLDASGRLVIETIRQTRTVKSVYKRK